MLELNDHVCFGVAELLQALLREQQEGLGAHSLGLGQADRGLERLSKLSKL